MRLSGILAHIFELLLSLQGLSWSADVGNHRTLTDHPCFLLCPENVPSPTRGALHTAPGQPAANRAQDTLVEAHSFDGVAAAAVLQTSRGYAVSPISAVSQDGEHLTRFAVKKVLLFDSMEPARCGQDSELLHLVIHHSYVISFSRVRKQAAALLTPKQPVMLLSHFRLPYI